MEIKISKEKFAQTVSANLLSPEALKNEMSSIMRKQKAEQVMKRVSGKLAKNEVQENVVPKKNIQKESNPLLAKTLKSHENS